MTDLHTHILPGMDDGARSAEESLALLRAERDCGVTALVLTPHYYPAHETPECFLRRRAEAMETLLRKLDTLDATERDTLPALYLGAEVAWGPNIADWRGLERLCCPGDGRQLLLELPSAPWDGGLLRTLYDLMSRTGLTPVLAHLERYLPTQPKRIFGELLAMALPAQLSADALLHAAARPGALRLIRRDAVQYLISDCHSLPARAPHMDGAAAVLRRRLGAQRAEAFLQKADDVLVRGAGSGAFDRTGAV